jgi:DNA-binding transcriptional LysR family regulator
MLHLGRLHALREVADRGTIAAAARSLHLTPSAVSQQISALEREVGEALVEPEGRGVRLTPVGRVLVRGADDVFSQVESLHAEVARHVRGERADLRVGAFATAITAIVAPAARELGELARFEVIEAEGEPAFARLARYELDVVVSIEAAGAPPRDDPRMWRTTLAADPMLAVLPADHPLAAGGTGGPSGPAAAGGTGRPSGPAAAGGTGRPSGPAATGADPLGAIPLAALADESWAVPPEGWLCERVIMAACQASGFTPRVLHRAGDWTALAALCAAGLGVALVPALADVTCPEGAVIRPVADPVPYRHIFAACRRGAETSPAVAALVDAMGAAASTIATSPRPLRHQRGPATPTGAARRSSKPPRRSLPSAATTASA